jgi:hypothetical protein
MRICSIFRKIRKTLKDRTAQDGPKFALPEKQQAINFFCLRQGHPASFQEERPGTRNPADAGRKWYKYERRTYLILPRERQDYSRAFSSG